MSECKLISIVTATYNRGYILGELYKSLTNQTIKDFEWIIVDDGSNDDTMDIVSSFIDENQINIIYLKQSNKGKHQALNLGIDKCKGDLILFVDSDDIISEDCVEFLINEWNKIKKNDKYAGISGVKAYFNGNVIGNNIKEEYIDVNSFDYRYKFKIKGDKAEAFRSEILKKHRFPSFENENFLTEETLFNRIANLGYILRWTNKTICFCDYREDGLTLKGSENFINNWNGTTLYIQEYIQYKQIPFMRRLYVLLWYFKMGLFNRKSILKILKKNMNN